MLIAFALLVALAGAVLSVLYLLGRLFEDEFRDPV